MTSRRKARECALQMLFQWDISKDSPGKVTEGFWGNRERNAERPESAAERSFANELFSGVAANIGALDALIRQRAEHWRLERMPAVDRNILRLAIYEMTHRPETPAAVVINEALEIARKFSDEESVAFVNGLLDRIRKDAENARSA